MHCIIFCVLDTYLDGLRVKPINKTDWPSIFQPMWSCVELSWLSLGKQRLNPNLQQEYSAVWRRQADASQLPVTLRPSADSRILPHPPARGHGAACSLQPWDSISAAGALGRTGLCPLPDWRWISRLDVSVLRCLGTGGLNIMTD